ncbi:MAG: 4Fe-4S dicluster domain-containing protein [candidate division WOR-3 bacterium]|nr:MAG: 4Fe-4S dicluster domain-containing protein [candidate division WOR-3 bacterium]
MKALRKKIRELFEKGEVDAVLGYREDPASGEVKAAVFKKDETLDDMVFDGRCIQNLVNYLPTLVARYRKVGVVLKGCDGRSLVTQLVEHRINKSQIIALGVGCEGVEIDGKEAEKCYDCATHMSPIADHEFGEKGEKREPAFAGVEEIEKMSPVERWKFFADYFAKCERCYACRQICPSCYCEICIADQQEPKWIEPSAKLSANTMWHLIRAYHLAGRCADCGECERVCPQDIPLRLLNNALEEAVHEMFGVRPGTVPEEVPPLVVLNKDDPDRILEGKNE